jgi:hypothetical protein
MVGSDTLAERAAETVLGELEVLDVATLKFRFEEIREVIEAEIFRLCLRIQGEMATESLLEMLLRPLSGPGPYTRDEVTRVIDGVADEFAERFVHLLHSRRSRSRRPFERSIRQTFRRLDYPFDESPVINGKPDFLMPGKDLFRVNPAECIIFTAKRTLRERWRQFTTEGKNFRLFLATIDKSVSERQLKEMLKQQVYLVIPKKKIEENPAYRRAENVISFEEFFRDFLDPAVERWRRKGWVGPSTATSEK